MFLVTSSFHLNDSLSKKLKKLQGATLGKKFACKKGILTMIYTVDLPLNLNFVMDAFD